MKYDYSPAKIPSLLFLVSIFFTLTSGGKIEIMDHIVKTHQLQAMDKRDLLISDKPVVVPDSSVKVKSTSGIKEIKGSKAESGRVNTQKTTTVVRPKGSKIPKGTGKPKGSKKSVSG